MGLYVSNDFGALRESTPISCLKYIVDVGRVRSSVRKIQTYNS